MSNIKAPKQRKYRVVASSRGLWRFHCQVKWLGLWWTIDRSDYEDVAKERCHLHANKVVWEGLLP